MDKFAIEYPNATEEQLDQFLKSLDENSES